MENHRGFPRRDMSRTPQDARIIIAPAEKASDPAPSFRTREVYALNQGIAAIQRGE